MIPETWETWQVVILMGFAGWAGFGLCTLLVAGSNADDAEGGFRAYRRGLINGSGLSPADLRLALGNVHDLDDRDRLTLADMREVLRDATEPDPMEQPHNWGAQ